MLLCAMSKFVSEEPTVLEIFAFAIFAVLVFLFLKAFCSLAYRYFLSPLINKVDFKKKGQWALVTGCTDGIGKEYAMQLAQKGCDIILVSRSMDKLNTTSQELKSKYNVDTKIVQADFTGGEEVYENIKNAISDLEIGTLVNNVGVSYPYPEYFLDIPKREENINNMIKANIVAITRMTELVLPNMVKRQKGVLINIGSASSDIPSPLLTVYAASKAYVEKFSDNLEMEYRKHGLIIQTVMPGFVCSNMSGIRRSTLFAPTAKVFVKSALSYVGTFHRTTGYIPHTIFVTLLQLITEASRSAAIWIVTRTMENSRRKAIKKYKSR